MGMTSALAGLAAVVGLGAVAVQGPATSTSAGAHRRHCRPALDRGRGRLVERRRGRPGSNGGGRTVRGVAGRASRHRPRDAHDVRPVTHSRRADGSTEPRRHGGAVAVR